MNQPAAIRYPGEAPGDIPGDAASGPAVARESAGLAAVVVGGGEEG